MPHLFRVLLFLTGWALAGWSHAASDTRLKSGPMTFTLGSNMIIARISADGRMLWRRATPGRDFHWLGSAGGLLIGTAKILHVTGASADRAFAPPPTLDGRLPTGWWVSVVHGLRAQDGRQLWSWNSGSPEIDNVTIERGVVIIALSSGGPALSESAVLDPRTGRTLLRTNQALLYQDSGQLVFGCEFMPPPYCSGSASLDLTRVDLKTLAVTRWSEVLPVSQTCPFDETAFAHEARYSARYAEYLVQDSCGWRYVRYGWGTRPQDRLTFKRLTTRGWPPSP